MNTLQKSIGFVLALTIVGTVAVFAPKAYAQEYSGCDFCGGDSTYYPEINSTYYPEINSTYYPSYDSTYYPSYDSTYYPSYDSTYYPSYDSTYYPSYDSTYYPSYNNSTYYPSYGSSYYPSVSGYPVSVGYPSSSYHSTYYPTPTPIPTPTPTPTPTPAPTPAPQASYSIVPVGQPIDIANDVSSTNTNTNDNTNTNTIRNTNTNNNTNYTTSNSTATSNSTSNSSVTNSGNSTNNINVTVNVPQQAAVTPIYQMPIIQYPVQYVYPQQSTYQPIYQAPYCTLTIQSNYTYGGNQATLTWTGSNATSAYISPSIGAVATYGSRVVSPGTNQIYTMTVYGQNGQSSTCQATYYYYTPTYYAPTYVPPTSTPAPYVSLSQIPYTGFDFGPVGDAIYWMVLLGFAVAAAYLIVYYRGGAFALATEVVRHGRSTTFRGEIKNEIAEAPIVAETPVYEKREHAAAPAFDLPIAEHENVTNDSMHFYAPEGGGVPRIVITRA